MVNGELNLIFIHDFRFRQLHDECAAFIFTFAFGEDFAAVFFDDRTEMKSPKPVPFVFWLKDSERGKSV